MNNTKKCCATVVAVIAWATAFVSEAVDPSITVTSPNGTQAWSVGGTATVSWTSVAVTGNVYILLYNNWTKVRRVGTVAATAGFFGWKIPSDEPAGNVYRFRVQSKNDTTVSGYSGTFTINAPKTLVVTAPNGGEVWDFGNTYTITWTSTGLWGSANIYLYDNWTKLRKILTVPIQSGTHGWNVPADEFPNNTYRIRVQSALDTSVNDYSDATFTIAGPPSIEVMTPNGGEALARGTAHKIAWKSTLFDGDANIYLYDNWTKIGIIGTPPIQDGVWTWNIPSDQTLKSTYRIRVQSQVNAGISDYSDALFEIRDFGAGATKTTLLPRRIPLVMAWMPAGSFQMGRYSGEQDSDFDEEPQHQVTFAQGFWMSKYELTKAQWTAVMGSTPWAGRGSVLDDPNSPAVYVSWDDAQALTAALGSYTGQTFKLPSEAQWEYACRAGTTARFYWGADTNYTVGNDFAWWRYNAWDVGEQYAHVVGLKLENAWGLCDMSGNVYEWCQDWHHSNYTGAPTDGSAWESPAGSGRVARGGGWWNYGKVCRSACRYACAPSNVFSDMGFRVCR